MAIRKAALSQEVKDEIIELRKQGMTYNKIGEELGVSPQSALNVCDKYFEGRDVPVTAHKQDLMLEWERTCQPFRELSKRKEARSHRLRHAYQI